MTSPAIGTIKNTSGSYPGNAGPRRTEAIAAYKKAIAYAPEAEAAQESKKYLSIPYRRL